MAESEQNRQGGGRGAHGGRGNRGRGQGGYSQRGDGRGSRRGGPRNDQRGGGQKRGGQRKQYRDQSVDMPRQVALKVIGAVRADDAYANLLLPKELRAAGLKGRDAAFATEITYGTLRAQGIIDLILAEAASRPLADIDGPLLDVLRLGTYQLLRTRVGAHAAVDTSVRAAAAVGGNGAKGFVNAVLRNVSRKSEQEWIDIVAPAPTEDPIGYVATKHAHPRWIAEAFAMSLGPAAGELQKALAADDERPIVHLAARPGEISAEELALVTGGEEGPWSPYCVRLDSGDPGQLDPVRQRLAAVQDEGSQLIARAVTEAPVVGEDSGRWLDLCAGPGGKTAFLGSIAAMEKAQVDAVEVSSKRAALVSGATDGLPVNVHVADGRDTGLNPGYDRVLVDAPCSGLGSLRRRPEARWRKSAHDVAGLTKLQFELLASAVQLTRPGGVIVYSTCSPHLRETRAIVDRAVKELGVEELPAHELVAPMDNVGNFPSVQMWPHRHGTDAMFFAVLRKPD